MEPEVDSAVTDLGASVAKLEADLAPYFAHRGQWESSLALDDRARLEVMAAYAVVAAYFGYLRASNLPVDETFLRALSTVHEYLRRVKDVEEVTNSTENKGGKRRPKMNTDAVKRLAKHNIGDEDDEPTAKVVRK